MPPLTLFYSWNWWRVSRVLDSVFNSHCEFSPWCPGVTITPILFHGAHVNTEEGKPHPKTLLHFNIQTVASGLEWREEWELKEFLKFFSLSKYMNPCSQDLKFSFLFRARQFSDVMDEIVLFVWACLGFWLSFTTLLLLENAASYSSFINSLQNIIHVDGVDCLC